MAGGKHFVDLKRDRLIKRLSLVDPVLDDLLQGNLLTQEQYDVVHKQRTSQKKMRQLYSYVTGWGLRDKDLFLSILQKHDQHLIWDLQDKSVSSLVACTAALLGPLPQGTGSGHLVDLHQDNLEQYDVVRSQHTSQEKINILQKHNQSLIRDLQDKRVGSLAICTAALLGTLPQGTAAKPEPGTSETDSSRKQGDPVDNTRSPPSYLTERLTCCICTNVFTDPVTLPCGHSFCMYCVRRHWANQHEREASCPLCAKIYMRKPELIKNHLLCNLVEEYRLEHKDGATNYV
ncbi:uncharacterized protein [Hyperolius riggenbachi]|uniref:uncharacterized protein n=1 Tax=Hyperolius riggenbachi TaxID=752182 RepID=UPI0035A2779E